MKVYWTESEKQKVKKVARQLYLENSDVSKTVLLQRAMELALPPNRRRPTRFLKRFSDILDYALNVEIEEEKAVTSKRWQELKQEQELPQEPQEQVLVTEQVLPNKYEQIIDIVSDVLSDMFSEILVKAVDKTIVKVQENTTLEKSQEMNYALKHNPLPIPVDRKRLSTVLVIGAKPDVQGVLHSRFDGRVSLKFWAEGSTSSLVDKAKVADYIMVNTQAISHQTQNTIKSVIKDKKLLYSNGGNTSTIRDLEDLVSTLRS